MITTKSNSPQIGHDLKKVSDNLQNNKDYIFALQLTYRENHTIYYMSKLKNIIFNEGFLKINHSDGGSSYYNYDDISEYHLINAEDITELWENEI